MKGARSRLLASILVLTLVPSFGCGDDDPKKPDTNAERFAGLWKGGTIVTGTSGPQAFVPVQALLDLTPDAAREGTLVLRYPAESALAGRIGATIDGSDISIEYLTDSPTTYRIEATLDDPDHLSGTLTTPTGDAGAVELTRVPRGEATAEPFLTLPHTGVLSMAHDGTDLWLSTTENDYLVVNPAGAVIDTVPVFYLPDTHWTSAYLTFGHGRFWGHLPTAIDNHPTQSRILPFQRGGILFDDAFLLPHLTSGLAHDGEHLWSLAGGRGRLFQIDDSRGVVTDSLELNHPDLYQLAFSGGHFWSLGWYISELYEFDGAGNLLKAYALPQETGFVFPGGVASDGAHLYYARSTPGGDSGIFRLTIH